MSVLVAFAVSLGAAGLSAVPADATALSPAATRAVHYLERAQNRDGGFGAARGQRSAPLYSGWVALGLASAGVPIGTLRAAPGRPTLLAYLRRGATAHDPGSLERTILALSAAGDAADARALAARLARRFSSGGSIAGQVNLTAFGLLALRGAGGTVTTAVQRRAASWLAREANRDGGYGWAGRGSQSDADDTGAVLEALGTAAVASGDRTTGAANAGVTGRTDRAPARATSTTNPITRARRRGVAYLRREQDRDGGFPAAPGEGSNAQSTAWAIQGLLAAGVAPRTLRRHGHTPLGYLVSLVAADGAVAYARHEPATPVWVTGEALMALTRTPLPIVAGG